jgi:hypothetical protein
MNLLGIDLNQPATYKDIWEWVSVSVPNLLVIIIMVALFVGALLLPFPKGKDES